MYLAIYIQTNPERSYCYSAKDILWSQIPYYVWLLKQQSFLARIVTGDRKKTWPIVNGLTLKQRTFLRKYKEGEIFVDTTFWEKIFVNELSGDAGISVWRVVLVGWLVGWYKLPFYERRTVLTSMNSGATYIWIDRCAPVSTGNTFQDLPRLRETADNTESYI
jgi:hypothetical protein